MIKVFIVSLLLTIWTGLCYELGRKQAKTNHTIAADVKMFNNAQIETIFLSELYNCNLKWDNSCGIGIQSIDGITYYTIDTADMNQKAVQLYLTKAQGE